MLTFKLNKKPTVIKKKAPAVRATSKRKAVKVQPASTQSRELEAWTNELALNATAVTVAALASGIRAQQNASGVAIDSQADVTLVAEAATSTATKAAGLYMLANFAAATAKATATVATVAVAGPAVKLLGTAGAIALAMEEEQKEQAEGRSLVDAVDEAVAEAPLWIYAAASAALEAAGFEKKDAAHIAAVADLAEMPLQVPAAVVAAAEEASEETATAKEARAKAAWLADANLRLESRWGGAASQERVPGARPPALTREAGTVGGEGGTLEGKAGTVAEEEAAQAALRYEFFAAAASQRVAATPASAGSAAASGLQDERGEAAPTLPTLDAALVLPPAWAAASGSVAVAVPSAQAIEGQQATSEEEALEGQSAPMAAATTAAADRRVVKQELDAALQAYRQGKTNWKESRAVVEGTREANTAALGEAAAVGSAAYSALLRRRILRRPRPRAALGFGALLGGSAAAAVLLPAAAVLPPISALNAALRGLAPLLLLVRGLAAPSAAAVALGVVLALQRRRRQQTLVGA